MSPESIGENRTLVDRVLQSSAYQPRRVKANPSCAR